MKKLSIEGVRKTSIDIKEKYCIGKFCKFVTLCIVDISYITPPNKFIRM